MDAIEFCPTALFMFGFAIVFLSGVHYFPGDESLDENRTMVLGLMMMFTLMGALGSISEGTIKNGPFLRRLPIHKGERVFWLSLENLFLSFTYVTVSLSAAIALFTFPWIAIELILLTWILGNLFVSIFFPLHVSLDSKVDSVFILGTGFVISVLFGAFGTIVFFNGPRILDMEDDIASFLSEVHHTLVFTISILCPFSILSILFGWRNELPQQTIEELEPRQSVTHSALSVEYLSTSKPGGGGFLHTTKPYRGLYALGILVISILVVLKALNFEGGTLFTVWITLTSILFGGAVIFYLKSPILPFVQTQPVPTRQIVFSALVFYLILALEPLVLVDRYGFTLFVFAITVLTLGGIMAMHSFSPLNWNPETGTIRPSTSPDQISSLVGWTGCALLIFSGAGAAWLLIHDSPLAFAPFLMPLAYNLWAMTWMYRRY